MPLSEVLIGAFASVFVKRLVNRVGRASGLGGGGIAGGDAACDTGVGDGPDRGGAGCAAGGGGRCVGVRGGWSFSVGAHSAYFNTVSRRNDANLIVPLTLLTPLLTIAFGTLADGG